MPAANLRPALTMTTVFIIRNHLGQFLSRHEEWTDGKDRAAIFTARYKDQAVNTMVEINTRDIDMRCLVTEVPLDDKGRPDIAAAAQLGDLPTPAPPVVLDDDDDEVDAATAAADSAPGLED
jgi:hypothetical protein